MQRKIIITGATGLIGKNIVNALYEKNYYVIIFSRNLIKAKSNITNAHEYVYWDYNKIDEWQNHLENGYAIIHLAGQNIISKRWNQKTKRNIYDSRVLTTRALIKALNNLKNKPECFISASAVGFYGNRENEVDEYAEKGNGFLADLVYDWENESKELLNQNIRVVNLRLGTVLSNEGGALKKFLTQFKFFLGGTIGDGSQWFPWIHIDDIVRIILFVLENNMINGPLNIVAPKILRMKDFSRIIGKVLHRPAFWKIPPFILKIILGEAADVLLSGAKVIPQRLKEFNYQFKYPNLEEALIDLITKKRAYS